MANYLFAEIQQWAKDAILDGYDFKANPVLERNTFFKKLKKSSDPKLNSKVTQVNLEQYNKTARATAPVIWWSFVDQFQSLLDDKTIFGNIHNLCIDPEDIFGPAKRGKRLNEITDAEWYQTIAQDDQFGGRKMFQQPTDPCTPRNVIFPIIFAVDKTGIDLMQRHGVEPLVFSCGLIRRTVRENYRAWKHLGLIPNTGKTSHAARALQSKKGPGVGRQYRNYQLCLGTVIQDLEKAMKNPPLVDFRIGEYVMRVRAHFKLAFGSVDGLGADQIVGRYITHHDQTARIIHSCMTDVAKAKNVFRKCDFFSDDKCLTQEKFMILSKDILKEKDKKIQTDMIENIMKPFSQHYGQCAFDGIDFGPNLRGILFALLTDILHAGREGIFATFVKILVQSCTNTRLAEIDKYIRQILIDCPGQRSRDQFNRINSHKGVTHLSCLAAHEWMGLIFALAVMASTKKGRKLLTPPKKKDNDDDHDDDDHDDDDDDVDHEEDDDDDDEDADDEDREELGNDKEDMSSSHASNNDQDGTTNDSTLATDQEGVKKKKSNYTLHDLPRDPNDLVKCLSCMLFFDAWSRQPNGICPSIEPTMTKSLDRADKQIRNMINMICTTLKRKEGNGWGLSKAHKLTHLVKEIRMFGSPMNWDTGTSERNHKWLAKLPSSSAQKRKEEIFLPQVGRRIDESNLVQLCGRKYGMEPRVKMPQVTSHDPFDNLDDSSSADSIDDQGEDNDCHYTGLSQVKPMYVCGLNKKRKHGGIPIIQWTNPRYNGVNVHPIICKELYNQFEDNEDHPIHCYTEYKRDGQLLRAHPLFQKEKPWYPWVTATFERDVEVGKGRNKRTKTIEENCLVKILAFVKSDGPAFKDDDGETDIVWLLVHACDWRNEEDRQNDNVLQRSYRLCYEPHPETNVQEPSLCWINADTIESWEFVVEETPGLKEGLAKHESNRVMMIHNKEKTWSSKFMNFQFPPRVTATH